MVATQPSQLATLRHRSNSRVDATLAALFDSRPAVAPRLEAAMRHGLLAGGKRLRPLLVYMAGYALGADDEALDAPAAAIELIHAYSLIHDDLPAMDDDDLRRGQPTVHKAFDEASAILAGDALQALAFEVLAGTAHPRLGSLVHTLASAAGRDGMVAGQALDGPAAVVRGRGGAGASGPGGDAAGVRAGGCHCRCRHRRSKSN